MTRTSRRPLATTLCALVALLTLLSTDLGRSSAAYTDQTNAVLVEGQVVTGVTTWSPQQTFLANTNVALQGDGSIAIWGYRGNGISGTGAATVAETAPVTVIALPDDGYPRVGSRRAVKVQGTSLDNYYGADASYTGLAALSDDGNVYTWGGTQTNSVMGRDATTVPFNLPGRVDLPEPVVDLASSSGVFMALTESGAVYTWGDNYSGRGLLGQGITNRPSNLLPQQVALPGPAHSIGGGVWSSWVVVGNYDETREDTGVFWWGWSNLNTFQTSPGGDGDSTTRTSAFRSAALSPYATGGCDGPPVGPASSATDTCRIRSMSGHYYGNQVLLDDGSVLAWGQRNRGGDGRGAATDEEARTPTPIPGYGPEGSRVVRVVAIEDIALALDAEGYVHQWGTLQYQGARPDGSLGPAVTVLAPERLDFLGAGVSGLGGSGYTPLVVPADPTVLISWLGAVQGGNNTRGQVRDRFLETSTAPTGRQPPTTMTMPGTGG